VHSSSNQHPQQLRLAARKLPEASTLDLEHCRAGIKPEDRRWYPTPPLRFLTTGDPRTSLTPVEPSQDLHESAHGDQKPGDACISSPRERRPSPPLSPRRRPACAASLARSSPRRAPHHPPGRLVLDVVDQGSLLWPERAHRRCAAVPFVTP
jgi:hypothetical protein